MEQLATHMIRGPLARASVLLGLGAMAACTTITATKFDPNVPGASQISGVPFTINRPVPTVTRTPGTDGKADVYSIRFDYVPDPNGRYTLQINPSTLSSVDFNMTFDANGSLTDTTAKTTDQTATILTSIGKFALAFAAFDKSKDDDVALVKLLSSDMNAITSPPNARIFDPVLGQERAVAQADKDAQKRLDTRLAELAPTGQLRKQFVYENDREYALLLTVLMKARKASTPDTDAAYAGQAKVVRGLGEDAKQRASEIDLALKAFDTSRLSTIRSGLVSDLARARNVPGAQGSPDVNAEIEKTLACIQLVDAAKSAIPPEVALLDGLVNLSPDEWKRRTLARLNREIDARRHVLQITEVSGRDERLHAPTDDKAAKKKEKKGDKSSQPTGQIKQPLEVSDSKLGELLSRKATVLGVSREFDRRQQVSSQLLSSSNPKDLKTLRDELGSLDTAIANAESALKPKTTDDTKAEDGSLSQYLVFQPGKVVSAQAVKNELDTIGKSRPKYVVVAQALTPSTRRDAAAPPVTAPSAPSSGAPPTPAVPPKSDAAASSK